MRVDLRTSFLGAGLAAVENAPARGAEAEAIRREIKAEKSQKRHNERRALSLDIEYHRKLSMSFACLSFVLLGLPLGLASRQRSRAMGFALGMGVAFCGYYPLMLLGKTLAESRAVAPWVGMWAPVAIITLLGTAWTVRAVRS